MTFMGWLFIATMLVFTAAILIVMPELWWLPLSIDTLGALLIILE